MRKLVGPFGSICSCEPGLNNLSFAHLEPAIFFPIFSYCTELFQLSERKKKMSKMKMSRLAYILSSAEVWALPRSWLCVLGSVPCWKIDFLQQVFPPEFPATILHSFCFLTLPGLCVSVNWFMYSKHNPNSCFHCLLAWEYVHYLP